MEKLDWQDYSVSTGCHKDEFAWDELLSLGFYHYYFIFIILEIGTFMLVILTSPCPP
jgi:hypothetical protein